MIIDVLKFLEESADRFPEKMALKDINGEVTYHELVQKSKQIGTYIRKQGVYKNRPIAVCIDRNIESIILFMGVVYSGNFYVPIDTNMPLQRIKMIMEELNPDIIFASASQTIEGYYVIPYENELFQEIDEMVLSQIRKNMIDTDPLYAIYTSGSTGKPKGVLVSHRSVIDLVEQFKITFPFPKEVVIGNQAPFDFDVSVKDIYNTFSLAGTMVVIPKQFFSMPLKLIEFLNIEKINTIIWAVSAMRIVENFKTFSKAVPQFLKLVMFSGEIMPVRVLNYWQETLPDTTYVNLYGPTEITCNCNYYIIDRTFDLEESIPIGKAFRNTDVFLMDWEKGQAVNVPKVKGEICVRGTCLSLGYYLDEEKTNQAFVQNPLQNAYPEKIYKTGDMGFYNEQGELCFSSRRDYQIKHMGHRIELGEIEVVVNAISEMDAAVCIFDEKKEKIVLCYQINECEEINSDNVKKKIIETLREKLPKFMWPNRYLCYNKLPLNKNGKIDRVLLKKTLEEEE